VTVNGNAVTPGAGGAISLPLTLADGANSFTIVATDNAGNTTQQISKVGLFPGATIGSGDLNGDGKCDILDAIKALQISVGLAIPTALQSACADVAPFAGGKPSPDGVIDTADVLVLLKRSVGLLTW